MAVKTTKEEEEKMKTSPKPLSILEWLAVHHMWIFACLVLPLSITYDLVYNFVLKVSYIFGRGARKHDEQVKDVQRQVSSD